MYNIQIIINLTLFQYKITTKPHQIICIITMSGKQLIKSMLFLQETTHMGVGTIFSREATVVKFHFTNSKSRQNIFLLGSS